MVMVIDLGIIICGQAQGESSSSPEILLMMKMGVLEFNSLLSSLFSFQFPIPQRQGIEMRW